MADPLGRPDLVVRDVPGDIPFAGTGGHVLLHMLARVQGRTSILVATKPSFGDGKVATASPDRLTHHCDIAPTGTESWRLTTRA
jgi:hypothetical protein